VSIDSTRKIDRGSGPTNLRGIAIEIGESAELVEMDPLYAALPVLIGFSLAIAILYIWVPRTLRRVQIAFNIGKDHYEVHRIAQSNEEAKGLLRLKGVRSSVQLYLMAVAGVLIMAMEILLSPYRHDIRVILLVTVLLGIPILLSPISALASQLTRRVGHRKTEIKKARQEAGIWFATSLALVVLVTLLFYAWLKEGLELPETQALGFTLLFFLLPSIVAYGRILGACWNILVFSQRERAYGRISMLHPEPASGPGRIAAIFVYLNVMAMPLTALNGVVSWMVVFSGFEHMFLHSERVLLMDGYSTSSLLSEGGIFGFYATELLAFVPHITIRQFAIAAVVLFLLLNVTIIGIAFIYEVIRLLFLGAADICGRFGIVFADPRTLRSEKSQQSRVLSFCFSGFAGYTVLLLVLSLFQRFPQFLPVPNTCLDGPGVGSGFCLFLEPLVITEIMITITVAGQAIFLLVWLLSMTRIGRLRRLRFDMNGGELEDLEGKATMIKVNAPTMQVTDKEMIWAARDDRLHYLANARESLLEQGASKRIEATRVDMLLSMCTGRWEDVEERATSLLAQMGGRDDMARRALAASALAKRDLEEAKEELSGFDSKNKEVIQMLWMLDLMRPQAKGDVDLDAVVHTDVGWRNQDLIERFATWFPWRRTPPSTSGPVDRFALLGDIALLRLHGEQQLARMIIRQVGEEVDYEAWPRLRVAEALLHIDDGQGRQAVAIHRRLLPVAATHPAVIGLGVILSEMGLSKFVGKKSASSWAEASVARSKVSRQEAKMLQMGLPTNPVAAMKMRRGADEALMANVWITSGKAAKEGVHPGARSFFSSRFSRLMLAVVGFIALVPFSVEWAVILFFGLMVHYWFSAMGEMKMRRNNMPALIRLASRLKRKKALITKDEIPVGTHLLLRGLVITIEGIPIDMGYPAWCDPRRKLKEGAVSEPILISNSKKQLRNTMRTISTSLARAQDQIIRSLSHIPRVLNRRRSGRGARHSARRNSATRRSGLIASAQRPWDQPAPVHRMDPRLDEGRARSSFMPRSRRRSSTKSGIGMLSAEDLGISRGRQW